MFTGQIVKSELAKVEEKNSDFLIKCHESYCIFEMMVDYYRPNKPRLRSNVSLGNRKKINL